MTDRRTYPSPVASAALLSSTPSPLASAVALAVAAIALSIPAVARGQATAAPQPPAESVLPGRPRTVAKPPVVAAPSAAAPAAPDATAVAGVALDAPFRSESAGIALRPPSGGKVIRRSGGDEVARFVNDEQKWRLVVSRITLEQPVPLSSRAGVLAAAAPPTTGPAAADAGASAAAARQTGFADSVAQQMPNETPGRFVRSELMPINGYDGAILAARFRESGGTFLIQQAVIRRTDKHYYVLSYTTPLRDAAGPVEGDPLAVAAVDAFGQVLDSVELIDQEQVVRDQTERLIATRGMMVNWTADRLRKSLVEEQWLRLIKDGRDVGYTYIVEELANDVPRADRSKGDKIDPVKALGVRIGVRSRTVLEPGQRVDAESWMWVSFDRGQEAFSNVVIVNARPVDAKGNVDAKAEPAVDYSMERGTSIRRDRMIPHVVPNEGGVGTRIETRKDDKYDLQLWATAKRQALPPLKRELPPFYLPQAMCHLLPRVVPLSQPKSYLFACYVPDRRDVMMRYVEVMPIASVDLGGRLHTAVPVRERIGLEGSVTTHYVTPDGKKYLGSVNEDNKITVVTTDAETLLRIWKDADLQRPGAVDDATVAGDKLPAADKPQP